MAWTWTYQGPDGDALTPEGSTEAFLTQAEAEDWIGLTWRELRESGVSTVTLHDGDRVVYGPMSLDPA